MLKKAQLANLARFTKKLPANAKRSVEIHPLPNHGVAAQAVSAGRATGSYAVYEKQIDESGFTVQYTKTTYDRFRNIISMKDKLTGEQLQ
jgi:hypothetical protein